MENKSVGFELDQISFQLGMINCFVEMVACGVKKMAISPPLDPADYPVIGPLSDKIAAGFGVDAYLEKSLMLTHLQSEEFTRGKWSVLYYRDSGVLQAYLELKNKQKKLKDGKNRKDAAEKEISRDFMRLLSYPEFIIEKKLNSSKPESPFLLTT